MKCPKCDYEIPHAKSGENREMAKRMRKGSVLWFTSLKKARSFINSVRNCGFKARIEKQDGKAGVWKLG